MHGLPRGSQGSGTVSEMTIIPSKFPKIRNIGNASGPNDGTRSVTASILSHEVINALEDWKKGTDTPPLLIGGLAFGYYARPRATSDIDLLFLNDADAPRNVRGFKKISPHRFRHERTHVDVEIVTPSHVNQSPRLYRRIANLAIEKDGVRIPSIHGLIASKICRFSRQDKADIEHLLKLVPFPFIYTDWPDLPKDKVEEFLVEFKNEI